MPSPTPRPTQQSERTPSLRESGDMGNARAELARAIPRRVCVSWRLGLVLAAGLAVLVAPAIAAEHWPLQLRAGTIAAGQPAPFTVRAPMFAGRGDLRVIGGVVVARGETATADRAALADAIAAAMPGWPAVLTLFAVTWALAAAFTHRMRRSTQGRLLRVQLVSLAAVALVAIATKLVLLSTAVSALAVPVAALAIAPTIAIDRTVGLATGALAALVVSLLAPFDPGLAIVLLVQATSAGVAAAERPAQPVRAALLAGLVATLCTSAAYPALSYLTTGQPPDLGDPLHSPWLAAALGPALAAAIAAPLVPLYQRLVGEIPRRALLALEDLDHPLLRQIAERAPGTWQHSLMLANMAELAASAIGANDRLVRAGAYFHDLGKATQPRYFAENLEPGETSPHDRLSPEASCDAVFAHVTDGILAARTARLHPRIIDFIHMHHGTCVLDELWASCLHQGNPNAFLIERFRYPGPPPQSRETAILAICDALDAASRTLHRPNAADIEALVERVVHRQLELGQLDDSGLTMADLRRISDALRDAIRDASRAELESRPSPAGNAASPATTNAASEASEAPRPIITLPGRVPGPPPDLSPAPALGSQPVPVAVAHAPSSRHPRPPTQPSAGARPVTPSSGHPRPPAALAIAGVLPRGVDDDARVTLPRTATPLIAIEDVEGGTTERSIPTFKLGDEQRSPRDRGARTNDVIAAADMPPVEEWSKETPVVSPSSAVLRVAFGQPDPTRQLPPEEVAALQRRAAELVEADRRRRPPLPTAEVDPDDIEAAIELAPPARRPPGPVAKHTVGANRPKKSE